MSDIQTLDSKVVYENKWLRLREDRIRRSSGNEGIYGVVEKPDFAIILPIEGDTVYMVEQYRYTIKQRQLELPQGAWEANPDADPIELAKGELEERKMFNYPPYGQAIRVTFEAADLPKVEKLARAGAELIQQGQCGECQILGPAPPPVERIRGRIFGQVRRVSTRKCLVNRSISSGLDQPTKQRSQ